MSNIVNIKDYGAVGNLTADDSGAIQVALDSNADKVVIPAGEYRIVKSLKVRSNTTIEADEKARLFFCGDTVRKEGDFLLSNADPDAGNADIAIIGGIWDGNNAGIYNVKSPNLFEPDGYSGNTLRFVNVKNLRLENIVVANTVSHNIAVAKIDGFVFRNIGFSSVKMNSNQDGLHFGGEVRHGVIERVHALTKGQTNDDMLALNADDSVTRTENRGLVCGDIEDIVIRDVYAEDCFTFIRMATFESFIRDIRVENVRGGIRVHAINADALRYCRTPLVNDADHPNGVGHIERVTVSGMDVYYTAPAGSKAMIVLESNAVDLKLENFSRDRSRDQSPNTPTIVAAHLAPTKLTFAQDGGQREIVTKIGDELKLHEDSFTLTANRIDL
jgi:polygalacturonase